MMLFTISLLQHLVTTAHAFDPPDLNEVVVEECPSGSISCHDDLIQTVGDIAYNNSSVDLMSLFSIVLFIMLAIFGIRLIINSRNDGAAAEAAKSYVNALIGALLVAGAQIFTTIVTDHTNVVTVNAQPLNALEKVGQFIIGFLLGALVLNLTIQGFRLIAAQDDSARAKARGNLLRALIGTAVVAIAGPIINFVVPGPSLNPSISNQFIGIANFLATIFGALSVFGFFIAGIMLVASVDESLQDRARKLMLTSIVSLVVVVSSYSLIQIFY